MKGKTTVPENWKHPNGPYRQSPAGEWWYVSPFTAAGTTDNASPWERFEEQPEPEALPEGFEDIFGKKPEFAGFPDSQAWTTARKHWEQNLRQFQKAGIPSWMSAAEAKALDTMFESWGMGRPRFFLGRYGEVVRWPDSEVPDFEQAAFTVARNPHQVVAWYQIDLAQAGGKIPKDKRHWFVPGWVFGDDAE